MKPTVVWITGLSGAGKTTTANALYEKCKDEYKTGLIDSDTLRLKSDKPIGFDMDSRWKVVNQMISAVRNMFEFQQTELVIVAMITPLKSMRDSARDVLIKYCDANFIEVYMDTPLETCEQRDPKGLYKKVRAGEIKDFTGIDSPYEIPEFPEVKIHPRSTIFGKMTVDKAIDIIYNRMHNTTIL